MTYDKALKHAQDAANTSRKNWCVFKAEPMNEGDADNWVPYQGEPSEATDIVVVPFQGARK